MLTPKPPVLAAIALLLLLPEAALAQARSSAGGSPAPSPRLSAPTTTLRTTPLSPGPTAPTTAQPGSTVPPLSSMSPPLPSQFATGGGSSSNLALSPGTPSGSPSEAAPSKPGGGGKSLADCMGFWDAATHMSKVEWRAACKRSMKEFPDVKW
jgi:hypothetical protein